jgi:hypothetical protein
VCAQEFSLLRPEFFEVPNLQLWKRPISDIARNFPAGGRSTLSVVVPIKVEAC